MSNKLYELQQQAIADLAAGPRFNWKIAATFDSAELDELKLTDVAEMAAKWRAPEVPRELYFNHAHYYGDGVKHIVRELKEKPTSNRALYCLLPQTVISGSIDTPIPSFMSLQLLPPAEN